MDNPSSPYSVISAIEHLTDLANRAVATLNLHCREDLSCMHRTNGSAAKKSSVSSTLSFEGHYGFNVSLKFF